MDYETIRFSLRDGIATATLNRPERKNALNAQMRAELTHAIRSLSGEARVLVLTGKGDAFCAGQDLGDGANAGAMDLERVLRDEYAPMLRAMGDCSVPIVAAVNGAAAGAGANLALSCDVVIAAEGAVFLQAFTRIGLIPDAGGSYWLPRQVGFARAMGAALFAEPITARQAADWGMIWEAVPDDRFADHWQARVRALAAGPTEAYRGVKRTLRASWDNDFEQQIALEAEVQGACGQTRDFKEGALAFAEKRPPAFEGR
ncbi:2-(1,2-epoxy-1,2-dihydrophenyl)acetyl-CoA isomerase [Palleronia sediminis]|uniref:2-(1,2-epoxy-1,2-dihydrophenyl)acetyl-CoA isomerase n=1 Tax=Palleronia sediminis TaxID=2547833 RepID=A0A4R6AJG3_9RHOB|nr:enoyl-CoA hydratase-related protein [Palleronia sediminis]TDL84120.1 2-(1,2-epoxy-1,2-dihydrophenyl)acetyl-CoA isomerase [Palleronia sediminis]